MGKISARNIKHDLNVLDNRTYELHYRLELIEKLFLIKLFRRVLKWKIWKIIKIKK